MEKFLIPGNVYAATKVTSDGKLVYAMVEITPDGSAVAIRLFSDLPAAEEFAAQEGYNVLNLGSGNGLANFLRRIKQPRVNHAAFDDKNHKAYVIEIDEVIKATGC